MLKKTLLSAAVASSFALSGCLDDSILDDSPSTTENAGSVTNPPVASGVFPVFSPSESKLPIPNDLIFDSTAADGSFSVPDVAAPVTTALNGLSGASTVAPIDIEMSGDIDPQSLVGQENPALQNVFLLELEYTSGDPVRGLSLGEPPTIIPGNQKAYAVEHVTLDGKSFIRINPKQPLSPLKRYIVVISTGVKDSSGSPIIQSPGAAGYAALTDETNPLRGSLEPLKPVQTLISFWEGVAFSAIPTLANDDDNIALTYSFTTSGDKDVVSYIAEPSTWFNDQLTRFLRLGAVEAAVAGGASDFATVETFANGAVTTFPSAEIQAALPTLFGMGAPCDGTTGTMAIGCVSAALSASFTGQFGEPTSTNITFLGQDLGGTLDANAINPAVTPGLINVVQGQMTVPYYSGLATDADLGPSALKFKSWEANEELATLLNFSFYNIGLSIPQGRTAPATDDNGDAFAPVTNPPTLDDFTIEPKSSLVNYNFPFPKKQGDVTVPVLAIYPTNAAGAMKTMIWGHGLTGNRTNVIRFGLSFVSDALANSEEVTVLAIDQPLHGIDFTSTSTGDAETDATNALYANLSLGANERHFGYVAESGQTVPTPIDLDSAGGSGSMFVNIESFLTTRDNNRQNILDLLTLRESIDTIDFNDGTDREDPDESLGVYYSGHSLGTISSQAMVAIANASAAADDDIEAAAFYTPGGGITRFFDNSPAFAGDIVDGLGALGFTTDSSSYQSFLNVLQGSLDSFDAVNFVSDASFTSTPVLLVEAISDLVIPVSQNSEDRTYNTITSNGFTVDGSVSYLSGAEPLASFSGATSITATTGSAITAPHVIRYKTCAMDHGTPSSGTSPDTDTFPATAYSQNVRQTVNLVKGQPLSVLDANLIETQTNPLPDWFDNGADRAAFCNP
ncbi:hypothetical protein A3715_06845 [Oleiphilus sp. HI0009]|nr:hypothetical protein A3715_06845 [Oleiphilus sp. HI0009]